ncbi:hypothetical protein [Spongiibacter sp.]|uniref:hypothetical protein n=1 Tax=Spongiibacter sp. TaxID=2024860 RepID=UPI00257AB069|nr:hypothetical protein [Spongiibacter sp.]
MNIRIVCSSLFVLLLLSACGGSSGNASIGGSNPDGSDADIYSVSSYSNTDTSDADLSGTWIYLEESDIEYISETSPLSSQRYAGKLRSIISVVDNGDKTVTLITITVQQTVPVGSGLLSFDVGGADFVGQVINNRLIEGEVISYDDEVVVHSGTAVMMKIDDRFAFDNDGRVGSFDLELVDYNDDSYSGSLVHQPIHSFSQANYEMTRIDGDQRQTDSVNYVYFSSISELPLPAQQGGEVWLDAHYVEFYFNEDSGKRDKNIYFQPSSTSNMQYYSRYKSVEIELTENTALSLSGTGSAEAFDINNEDINIQFHIGL